MKSRTKYWHIICEQHSKSIFEAKINTKHISEKKLMELIRVLLSKYALADQEILEQYVRIPFKKKKGYFNIKRYQNTLDEPLLISFCAQIADISIAIWLKV